ncbi:MAG: TIGR02757 family protein [Sandaracinaceae bacterium]
MKAALDALLTSHDAAARRATDPVSFVHRYEDPHDREVAGLVAALVAFGQVQVILRNVDRALAPLHPAPARTLAGMRRPTLLRGLADWRHRTWRGEHLATVLWNARALRRREGSLGAAFGARLEEAGELKEGLSRFADALRGPAPDRGLAHLVPDPRRGSACKRLLLYLRWMCRPADGVDVGIWPVPASALLIPVDTHVQRIAQNLRLTDRADASWRTAEEITASLRKLDASDPVKYDFAICHLGVSRQCPSRRDEQKCGACVLRSVCRRW